MLIINAILRRAISKILFSAAICKVPSQHTGELFIKTCVSGRSTIRYCKSLFLVCRDFQAGPQKFKRKHTGFGFIIILLICLLSHFLSLRNSLMVVWWVSNRLIRAQRSLGHLRIPLYPHAQLLLIWSFQRFYNDFWNLQTLRWHFLKKAILAFFDFLHLPMPKSSKIFLWWFHPKIEVMRKHTENWDLS